MREISMMRADATNRFVRKAVDFSTRFDDNLIADDVQLIEAIAVYRWFCRHIMTFTDLSQFETQNSQTNNMRGRYSLFRKTIKFSSITCMSLNLSQFRYDYLQFIENDDTQER